ncbi:MAG: hypothetical protein COZ46_04185 [Verrucomicrobia bacterium CG_4_10_14_3_um_filter_43_23]|nr:MAG: hypothetical protein AUJ82_07530 [Verrucomicrobia bacterium CG1_02_43_26]PIP58625.1 MAG: hypothetical protein COX01_07755 [Verrucomicrobia bacterium CG22_combo_CG10-13_8_21_14_all_43_17]PIX58381.1 MAG: hypothetical protein COZ46_04185 [Verrucomicrobia bacterium CG_4_10_14_3_um_filter_43_23]PIY61219.1 MAG: hypothetical protein COY94_06405 [Verrucomicrobia bacterium CG_4_10_14_0_8_um_filter_43_34]PJA44966.1 MAG: hypothetical protein CO175_00150 [Verrucomicrobia bacterium CG_4_9_14_3_um_fi
MLKLKKLIDPTSFYKISTNLIVGSLQKRTVHIKQEGIKIPSNIQSYSTDSKNKAPLSQRLLESSVKYPILSLPETATPIKVEITPLESTQTETDPYTVIHNNWNTERGSSVPAKKARWLNLLKDTCEKIYSSEDSKNNILNDAKGTIKKLLHAEGLTSDTDDIRIYHYPPEYFENIYGENIFSINFCYRGSHGKECSFNALYTVCLNENTNSVTSITRQNQTFYKGFEKKEKHDPETYFLKEIKVPTLVHGLIPKILEARAVYLNAATVESKYLQKNLKNEALKKLANYIHGYFEQENLIYSFNKIEFLGKNNIRIHFGYGLFDGAKIFELCLHENGLVSSLLEMGSEPTVY